MFNKRIKIFIIFSSFLLLVCVARLAQMQLLAGSRVQNKIAELKKQSASIQQLNTLRGKILDRKARELAIDEPRFWLNIDYSLSQYWDERIQKCMLMTAAKKDEPQKAISEVKEEINNKIEDIELVISKCEYFDIEPNEIEGRIRQINDDIWNLRAYMTRIWFFPDQEFEQVDPDPNERDLLVFKKGDIAEINKNYPILELETEDAIFIAQIEFQNIEGIKILPRANRHYPYGTAAAQTIGWVRPAKRQEDKELFAADKLRSYLEGEVCGEEGVEYVCEEILRGRRGEKYIDIDENLISHTDIKPGNDVVLTLDIVLQQRIEKYMAEYPHEPNCGPGMAAVVLDVETDEILALVSLPVYDLNRARYDFGTLSDPNGPQPLINRAINVHYPPGSVVKPLILIAGLETGMITPDEVISCPAHAPEPGWPRCLIWRRNPWMGHDNWWENNARNAIKGSCNIYFSKLADMMDSAILQHWLFMFGYGRTLLSPPKTSEQTEIDRNMRQLSGAISSTNPKDRNPTLAQMPPLRDADRKMFGIGQGNLRVTPLQVANTMATIARGGISISPILFRDFQHPESTPLNISKETLDVVYDGMSAVVNETNGTANKQFGPILQDFAAQDVKIYGKTGSTEGEEHAWFAGFAEDSTGRKLAFAVIVEGGQHGSSDAAPLASEILQICIQEGYIGRPANPNIGI
ncbi:MAG: hypothetical protein JW715_12575 [Sedimentisphaerales bacterium]|nr:hypothetical protein [Sedimentisphaerales bacterium]